MKKYIGVAWGDEVYVEDAGKRHKLNPHLDLWNQSPTGFSWGNAQAGSTQLAFALLYDAMDDDDSRAMRYAMRYKHRVIATLGKDMGWTIPLDEVLAQVDAIEKIEKDTNPMRRRIDMEPAPNMSDRGQGVVWDVEK